GFVSDAQGVISYSYIRYLFSERRALPDSIPCTQITNLRLTNNDSIVFKTQPIYLYEALALTSAHFYHTDDRKYPAVGLPLLRYAASSRNIIYPVGSERCRVSGAEHHRLQNCRQLP